MIELTDTNSAEIAARVRPGPPKAGSPAMGMVMTLVIVVAEEDAEDAMDAARAASHEHPARVLGVILGDGRGAGDVDAQVGIGAGWAGETALIRLQGEVVKHPETVVLPLLLPDSPVVIWWPSDPPDDPADDPLGVLAQRRITDARRGTRRAARRCPPSARSTPGNTDLAWTRVTGWRALLAAALDQHPAQGHGRVGHRPSGSTPAPTCWRPGSATGSRSPVDPTSTPKGPGITEVVLDTEAGPITITRPDGRLATFSSPGQPDRPVALKRRTLAELLAEELRRLDEDDVYAATARRLLRRAGAPDDRRPGSRSTRTPTSWPTSAAGELLRGWSTLRRPAASRRWRSPAERSPTSSTASSPGVSRARGVDWTRVVVWWGDERFVGPGSPDRNDGQAREALLDAVGVDPTGCTRCRPPRTPRASTRARRRTPTSCASTAPASSRS